MRAYKATIKPTPGANTWAGGQAGLEKMELTFTLADDSELHPNEIAEVMISGVHLMPYASRAVVEEIDLDSGRVLQPGESVVRQTPRHDIRRLRGRRIGRRDSSQ